VTMIPSHRFNWIKYPRIIWNWYLSCAWYFS